MQVPIKAMLFLLTDVHSYAKLHLAVWRLSPVLVPTSSSAKRHRLTHAWRGGATTPKRLRSWRWKILERFDDWVGNPHEVPQIGRKALNMEVSIAMLVPLYRWMVYQGKSRENTWKYHLEMDDDWGYPVMTKRTPPYWTNFPARCVRCPDDSVEGIDPSGSRYSENACHSLWKICWI